MHDVYMSYWSAGYQKKPDRSILLMTKIANHFANKNFYNVYLITDSSSAQCFKKMDWANISTDLDCLDPSLGGIWSLGKILSYKIAAEKNKPFIHIDYDVILWEGMPEKLIHSEVFAQNEEPNAFEDYEVDKFLINCPNPSPQISLIRQNSAANMGIFGGTNMNFIYSYSLEAMKLAQDPKNYKFWTTFKEFYNTWNMATIVEQYFMTSMSQIMSQYITYLFDNGWPTKHEAAKCKYTHFMGDKTNKLIANRLNNICEQNDIKIDF